MILRLAGKYINTDRIDGFFTDGEYSRDLKLWIGGSETPWVLEFGSIEEVEDAISAIQRCVK